MYQVNEGAASKKSYCRFSRYIESLSARSGHANIAAAANGKNKMRNRTSDFD
jgi:hypothetical protein